MLDCLDDTSLISAIMTTAPCLPLLLLVAMLLPSATQATTIAGHAHNDYEHPRPLLDALEHGFESVEADIWLRDGQLLIGHDEADLVPGRTLQSLYLDPLQARPPKGNLILLIDIKTDGEATYAALSKVLADYSEILSQVENDVLKEGPVTAIISGNRPLETMAAEDLRFAFYDGRLSDLTSGIPNTLMPLVSDNWARQFGWTGAGEIPTSVAEKLAEVVTKADAAGYRLRFWATPDGRTADRDALWCMLSRTGVDFINTDDLFSFTVFKTALATNPSCWPVR